MVRCRSSESASQSGRSTKPGSFGADSAEFARRAAAVFGRDLLAAAPDVGVRGRAPERFYDGVALTAEGNRECQRARRASSRHS